MNIPWHDIDVILWASGVELGMAIGMLLAAIIWWLSKKKK